MIVWGLLPVVRAGQSIRTNPAAVDKTLLKASSDASLLLKPFYRVDRLVVIHFLSSFHLSTMPKRRLIISLTFVRKRLWLGDVNNPITAAILEAVSGY